MSATPRLRDRQLRMNTDGYAFDGTAADAAKSRAALLRANTWVAAWTGTAPC